MPPAFKDGIVEGRDDFPRISQFVASGSKTVKKPRYIDNENVSRSWYGKDMRLTWIGPIAMKSKDISDDVSNLVRLICSVECPPCMEWVKATRTRYPL